MPLSPTQKLKARRSITAYCLAARNNEDAIHYSQRRPFHFVDQIGTGYHVLDCSGFVVNCLWNAHHDLAYYIPDPSGQKYSGWGNTWTMESWLRAHGKRVTTQPYLPGDIAMFDGHTMICHKKGSVATSDWTSHGWEGGPELRKLDYRADLVGVWRHPSFL